MATDEERAIVMAEYMASLENDEDDFDEEADFDPSEEDDDDEDDEDDDDSSDGAVGFDEFSEEKKKNESYMVLKGSLHLNEEGRAVYTGFWEQSHQSEGSADEKQQQQQQDEKKKKFKLKSKQLLLDLSNPTVTKKGRDPPAKRSILFDGFFVTGEEDGHRKIKERDVDILFESELEDVSNSNGISNQSVDDDMKKNEDTTIKKNRFKVNGTGCNEFGPFEMEGHYILNVAADGLSISNSLVLEKRYGDHRKSVISTTRKKRPRDEQYEDHEDELAGDGADFEEILALNEEANMTVEELRKLYYGREDDENGEDKEQQAKRCKNRAENHDESGDDECGF